MKVKIEDKEYEVEPSQLILDDGYALITPDNVPDGYFKQEAMEAKIKERLSKARENAKSDLLEDASFNKQVLNKYGVQLDADGNPAGLKPTVDVNQVKKDVAESLREEYEAKLQEKDKKLNSFINKGLKSSIIDGANNIGIDGQYLNPLVEGGDPYLVKELSDKFQYNPELDDYALVEPDGTFAVEGDGYVTTNKFFEKNKDRFKHMLKDQRQRGSNFNGQGKGTPGKPQGNPAKWSLGEKTKFIQENGRDGYKAAVDSYVKSQKEKE